MKKISIIIIFMLLFPSCALFQESSPELIHFIPRETDVPGWELKKTNHRSNGGIYRNYDVHENVSAVYRSFSDKNIEIIVEILKFNTPLDAFILFSYDRGFKMGIRYAGDDFYISDNGKFQRVGEYYIKVICENINDRLKKDLDYFLSIITGNLIQYTDKTPIPAYITLFSDNNSRQSIVFFKNGHNLVPVIKKIFLRRRVISGKERYIYFRKYDTGFDALTQYNKLLKSKQHELIYTRSGKPQIAFKRTDNKKYVFISLYKELIFGILNADSIEEGNRITMNLYIDLKNKLN